jgi:hypothetical protein
MRCKRTRFLGVTAQHDNVDPATEYPVGVLYRFQQPGSDETRATRDEQPRPTESRPDIRRMLDDQIEIFSWVRLPH